jgi:putative polyhydroxyalkanoate system protein
MADIDLKREHELGLKGARAAADHMAAELRKKFGLSGDWKGNTLHFERAGVSGALEVAESVVRITATLGFLMKAMKPSIEKAIASELDRLVATAPRAAAPAGKKAPSPAPKPVPSAKPKTAPKTRK